VAHHSVFPAVGALVRGSKRRERLGMTNRRRAIESFATSMGVAAMGLISSALLSRLLGPAGRGEIAAILLWPGILTYASSMGLIAATVYHVAARPEAAGSVLRSALGWGGAYSTTCAAVFVLLVPLLLAGQRHEVRTLGQMMLVAVPLGLTTQLVLAAFQGRALFRTLNVFRLAQPTLYLAGILALYQVGRLDVPDVVAAQLAIALLLCAAAAMLVSKELRLSSPPDPTTSKSLRKYGLKHHIGVLAAMGNQFLDQALMAMFLAPQALGIYVVAIASANFSQQLGIAVRTIATPAIAKTAAPDQPRKVEAILHQYLGAAAIFFPFFGIVLPFAIPLVFGPSFGTAVYPAEVLLVGFFFSGVRDVVAAAAEGMNDPGLVSGAYAAGLVATVIFLTLLLEPLGVLGAAVATAASSAVQAAVLVFGMRSRHRTSLRRIMRPRWSVVR
jgi:O-antigen/teichoic acid export membrane protein